jgi:hypothetical protein
MTEERPIAADPDARRPATWPPAARWAVGCGTGCALLVALQGLVIWGALSVFFFARPPEGLAAQVTTPKGVAAGRKFPLTLTVRNEGADSMTVTNVAVRSDTLEWLTLENPQPPALNHTAMLGSAIWSYQQTVEPGKSWTLRFDATARRAGAHEGALEVQVGFVPKAVRFSVEAREGGS